MVIVILKWTSRKGDIWLDSCFILSPTHPCHLCDLASAPHKLGHSFQKQTWDLCWEENLFRLPFKKMFWFSVQRCYMLGCIYLAKKEKYKLIFSQKGFWLSQGRVGTHDFSPVETKIQRVKSSRCTNKWVISWAHEFTLLQCSRLAAHGRDVEWIIH